MTKLQDPRAWDEWLRNTRVHVSLHAARASSRTRSIPRGRDITRRGIRPQLSAINYQVLTLFAKSDILIPDLPSPGSSAATIVPIPTPSLPRNAASYIDPSLSAQLDSPIQIGKNIQTRSFCSAFWPYSRNTSIRRTRPAKSQRRAHPTAGRMSVCVAGLEAYILADDSSGSISRR
jgi:hypothetical protein